MAITLDTISEAGSSGGTNSRTVSHTVGAGSNLLLVVQVVNWGNSDWVVSGITWNTTENLTLAKKVTGVSQQNAEVWYLIAPTTGTHDCVVTFTGSPDGHNVAVISLFGAKQSAQPDSTAGDEEVATSRSETITTVADDCWVFDAISDGSSVMAPTSPQVTSLNQDGGTSMGSYKPDIGVAGAETMAWTWGGISERNVLAIAAFAPALATAPVSLGFRGLMGVGQ